MGQYWHLVNVTRNEMDASGGKLPNIYYAYNRFLVESLIVPFPNKKITALHAGEPTPTTGCKLLTLPLEMIELFYERFGFEETVCFALTCKTLLAYGEEYVNTWMHFLVAKWADCRLVCIGDYDSEFLDRLDNADRRAVEQDSNLNPAHPDAREPSLFHYASEHYAVVRQTVPRQLIRVPMWERRDDYERCCTLVEPDYGEPRDDWVVANSTKREYVRATAVAALSGRPDDAQPSLPRCGAKLGQAILSRICWSSSDEVNMPYEGGINRGVWAGDKFRITTIDRLWEEGGWPAEYWTDVSKEVCEEMTEIWKVNLEGGGWDYFPEPEIGPHGDLNWELWAYGRV